MSRLVDAPLGGLTERAGEHLLYRDVYLDTADGVLAAKGVRCWFRTQLDGRRFVMLDVGPRAAPRLLEAETTATDFAAALAGASEPVRRLSAIVDPARLSTVLELSVARRVRHAAAGFLGRRRFSFAYDTVTVRRGELGGDLYLLTITGPGSGTPSAAWFASALSEQHGLRMTMLEPIELAELLLAELEASELAAGVSGRREVTVIAVEQGRLALGTEAGDLSLPFMPGSGEHSCREVLREALGSAEGQVALLGTVPATQTRPAVEVWLARRLHRGAGGASGRFQWFTPAEIIARVGTPVLRDPKTLAALSVAARSVLMPEWAAATARDGDDGGEGAALAAASRQTLAALRVPMLPTELLDSHCPVPEQFLNAELSWLEFNARVLALAEDPGVPLLARVRFAAIFSTNLDEFFGIKIAGLKVAAQEGDTKPSPDGLRPQETLEALQVRLRPLIERAEATAERLLRDELPRHGIRVVRWPELDAATRDALCKRFDAEIFPLLTPKAITMAPGHPFPVIEELLLSLAVVVRDPRTGVQHFGHVKVPDALPRFVDVTPGARVFVPIEDIIRANAAALFPGREVEGVFAFRLTRAGDLELQEEASSSFAQAVAEEVRRRPRAPVVRIEVGRDMPETVRGLLLRELRFEEADHADALAEADVYAARGLVNIGALHELADLDAPALTYPPFTPADPFEGARSIIEQLDEHDVLVHHPYDRYESTVQRFIAEAADDERVSALKLTLYRPGGPSALGAALERAAQAGKEVTVFVELKARFDEERNLAWVKHLERAGIHVVTGLVRLKTHAKVALIVCRTPGGVRRYAHIGTGNYNPVTARQYTDLGLFTARPEVTGDLAALFNELTGSSGAPQARFNALLVSPTNMLPRFLELIRRESEHAKAGRSARIRAKLNALNDGEIIGALYEASQVGVNVDLVVRGIATLRPGVPGLSERIRVVSAVGRFLEHARIYHFTNGGADEYYIGSADWRPRNLRRRVEVVTPVVDPRARERLAFILDTEIDDPQAYELQADGSYLKVRPPTGVDLKSAQETFVSLTSS